MTNASTPAAQGGNAVDVIACIKAEAAALVARVNPGVSTATAAFEAKAAEVAETLTRRLCLNLAAQGRADLARLIRIAWNQGA